MIRRLAWAMVSGALLSLTIAVPAHADVSVTLEQSSASSTVGEDVLFTARASYPDPDGSQWASGLTVTFSSSDGDWSATDETNEDGYASVRHTREQAGTERITASVSLGELGADSSTVSHEWLPRPLPQPSIALAPRDAKTRVGRTFTITATVTARGEAVRGVPLAFEITGLSGLTRVTNGSGAASVSWTKQEPGSESITVRVAPNEQVTQVDTKTTHTWTPLLQPSIALAPRDAKTRVGRTFTITATVTARGEAVRGVPLAFEITGLSGLTRVTNGSGAASVSWTKQKPGSESIRVRVGRNEEVNRVDTKTTHTWTPPPVRPGPALTLTATPADSTAVSCTSAVVDATARLGEAAAAGAVIRLRAEMPLQDPVSVTATASAAGTAGLGYKRCHAGTDRVHVTATLDGQTASVTVIRRWTEPPPPPAPRITLAPDDTATQVGVRFRVRATVTLSGQKLPRARVHFRATMAGDALNKIDTTDARGRAYFTHSRAEAGRERIRATLKVNGVRRRATVAHSWTAQPPPDRPPGQISPVDQSGSPGDPLALRGSGCSPGQVVDVFFHGEKVATTVADDRGRWKLSSSIPDLPLGRYRVTTNCSPTRMPVTVDVVGSTVGTGAGSGSGAVAGAVLLFFVLLGQSLLGLRSSAP